MNSRSEVSSLAASHFSAKGWKVSLYKTGYFISIAVAMVGWVAGSIWLAMLVARSLFF